MRSAIPLLLLLASALGTPAYAASLRIEPVLIEVMAPGVASTMRLQNDSGRPIDVQIRVFRWVQVDGTERLEPTDDVVASPPAVSLAPGAEYVARIVRVTKRAVSPEESYRLFVDQLPDLTQQHNGTVNFLVRQSIPVFFGQPQRSAAAPTWSIVHEGKTTAVVASNAGERRERIAALRIHAANGETISLGSGLVGYVLGRSTMKWTVPGGANRFKAGETVSISADTDQGPIQAAAPVRRGS
jgi:fimbrial chaperone protein